MSHPIDMPKARERMAAALRQELEAGGPERWYYISIANETTFHGGIVVPGYGETDAWMRCHGLNVIPRGYATATFGPIPDDVLLRIPPSNRLRLLNREEAIGLGS